MKWGRRWAYGLLLLVIIVIGGALAIKQHLDAQNARQAEINRSEGNRPSSQKNASRSKNKPKETVKFQAKGSGDHADAQTNDITMYLKKNHFVGSALIIKNDRFLYRRAFGYANYADRIKNRTNSEFQILSIQKSLTAACIMKLVQERKLSLKTPLAHFYPTISNATHIRIRNMLDMDSGLSMKEVGSARLLNEKQVVAFAVKHLSSKKSEFDKWQYQPVNYVLLSGIISRLTGETYKKYFEQTFIKPMNLKGTGFVQDQPLTLYKTTGYRYQKANQFSQNYRRPFNETQASMNNELGTGQVYMTAFELFKAEHRLLQGKVISLANVRILHTSGSSSTYGGGVYNQTNGIRSHGIGYGYESSILESRDGKNGVVLLSNNYRPVASIQNLSVQLFNRVMNGKLN